MDTTATKPDDQKFRFISRKRKAVESRRFVTGHGTFVADVVRPRMQYVALVKSPYPAARIVSLDASRALALPGVRYVLTGDELAKLTEPVPNGLNTPKVIRYPLAVDVARYAGEWVAAIVADSRALAEDGAELVDVQYEPLSFVLSSEKAATDQSVVVHAAHASNVLIDKTFTWGNVDEAFANAAHCLEYKVHWGRSSTVPIETFGVVAEWNEGEHLLDVWASIQMPKYEDQLATSLKMQSTEIRVHYDVDVGGSFGSKRGIKQSIICGYLAKKLRVPIRLIEDRMDNLSGGDAHGPDRIFKIKLAFEDDGRIDSIQIDALEDMGAYAGRAPFQLGKPVGSIVGPYKIGSARYRLRAVTTNKAVQEAVRGFGQAPTNYALETGIDKIARYLKKDPEAIRTINYIGKDEFPYKIPSGAEYDSGDYITVQKKTFDAIDLGKLRAERDRIRHEGGVAGIGISACLEPGGGNAAFEPLLNERNKTTVWMESARVRVDARGGVTVVINNVSSGQGHETLASTVAGEVLDVNPDLVKVVRGDSLSGMPSNSPVASRMAIMLGGAVARAARLIRGKMAKIAAYNLRVEEGRVEYVDGNFRVAGQPARLLSWSEVAHIAYRNMHLLPAGMSPGLEETYVLQVPNGGQLPDKDGRVLMYPCYTFEFHTVLVVIDQVTGSVELRRYAIGHDCGTVISPDIVRGVTLGGIAHGIGASLYEEFGYSSDGDFLSQTFMDYTIPSAYEVPDIVMIHNETPSPLTEFGQKGAGEGGYMGSPAAISNAINDALSGQEGAAPIHCTPITPARILAALSGEESS